MEGYNEVSFDDWDDQNNKRAEQETEFSKIVSRRAFLGYSTALGASTFLALRQCQFMLARLWRVPPA